MSGIKGSGRQQRVNGANAPYGRNNGGRSAGEVPSNRVFVGNLSWDVTWQNLKDHMKSAGRVTRADVMTENSGRSKGCGIVEFASAGEAQQAIRTLNDTELMGRLIFVREDREDPGATRVNSQQASAPVSRVVKQDLGGDEPQPAKLGISRFVYVGNLSWDVAWQDLKDHMKAAGEVLRADVLMEQGRSGRSKGCGIVEFSTVEEANRAITHLNNTELKGRLIFVREDRERTEGGSMAGAEGGPGCRLYVGNLAWNVRWQDLKDHFKQVAPVIRADVIMEDGGERSKGFGIVEFATPDQARMAMDQLHDSTLNDRPIHVREDREPAARK